MFSAVLLASSLTFNVLASVGTTFYAWKIVKLETTPRMTWSLKLVASLIGMVQLAWGVLYVNDTWLFISSFPPATLLGSYALAALRTGLIYVFVRNVYLSLEARSPTL